jgi:hypothetical protein
MSKTLPDCSADIADDKLAPGMDLQWPSGIELVHAQSSLFINSQTNIECALWPSYPKIM